MHGTPVLVEDKCNSHNWEQIIMIEVHECVNCVNFYLKRTGLPKAYKKLTRIREVQKLYSYCGTEDRYGVDYSCNSLAFPVAVFE